MQDARSIRFAEAVQTINRLARVEGWCTPSYRSPPGVPGTSRTIRRRADGSSVVAVLLHGRPWDGVVADLIEGVVVANALHGPAAERCRTLLWATLGSGEHLAAA